MACDLATIEEYKLRNRVRDLRDVIRLQFFSFFLCLIDNTRMSGKSLAMPRKFYTPTLAVNLSVVPLSGTCRRGSGFFQDRMFLSQRLSISSWFVLTDVSLVVFTVLIATQNPRPLIHYIISLVFASLKDLGFDPTVRRVAVPLQESPGNNTQYAIQYDYHVGSHVYRTVECLSTFRAAGLISRGSRVWKVYRVGDPEDKYYALKDVWIPDDAMTEGEIQQSAFESIQNSLTDQVDFKQYFIEIEECELVVWNSEVDRTSSFMRRQLPDQFHTFLLGTLASSDSSDRGMPSRVTGSTIATPKGAPDGGPAEAEMNPRYRYSNKKHCRIIYKDVGKPLDSLTHPHKVLQEVRFCSWSPLMLYLYQGCCQG